MPLRSDLPIVRVEHGSMHTIETRNAENLFGLWSVFSKCSPAMEDGKRYENMAWRLWSRETFCCQPDPVAPPHWSFKQQFAAPTTNTDVPELSTSVASDDSNLDSAITTASRSDASGSRPDLRRHDSTASQARGKHITPTDLEKVVNSIHEKKTIEPLSPLPPQLAPPTAELQLQPQPQPQPAAQAAAPASASPPLAQLSTSTFATARGSDDMSPCLSSDASTSTDMSQHSVVRGFEPGHISTSVRSSTNLNPTPILKKTPSFLARPPPSKMEPPKKKQPMFTLGGSSDEDNSSSLEAYSMAHRSSLSETLKRAAPPMRKITSFSNQVSTRTLQDLASESEGAIETDSEDEPDESAIEEDDSEDDWEDDDNDNNDESRQSSMIDRGMFSRVDSKPNLVSHRSLLTTMMHEGDRAQAMQSAATRGAPAIRRSRTTTPNGPSIGSSPQEDSGLMMRQQASRAKPIIMTTSNVHPPALSPRTTRRNMLQTELSGSLRQNLLWERQQKNATTNAALRRAMTTTDIKGMSAIPQQPSKPTKNGANSYFDAGLQSYHTKGW